MNMAELHFNLQAKLANNLSNSPSEISHVHDNGIVFYTLGKYEKVNNCLLKILLSVISTDISQLE